MQQGTEERTNEDMDYQLINEGTNECTCTCMKECVSVFGRLSERTLEQTNERTHGEGMLEGLIAWADERTNEHRNRKAITLHLHKLQWSRPARLSI